MRRRCKVMSLLMVLMVSVTACGQTAGDNNTSVITESESVGGMVEVEITPLPESAENITIVETPAPTAIPVPTATPAPEYEDYVIEWNDAELERIIRSYLNIYEGDVMYSDVLQITKLEIYDKIADISALRHFTNLTELWIVGNREISDYSPLGDLPDLKTLRFEKMKITDSSFLSECNNLESLYCTETVVCDISALANLPNLTDLFLHVVKDTENIITLEGASALTSLTNLKSLSLIGYEFNDLSVVSGLTDLERLHWSPYVVNYTDITPLANLTKLEDLSMFGQYIKDVTPLSNLTNLKNLDLRSNSITDIGALSEMTRLTNLRLGSNRINDISALSKMTNLAILDLSENQIIDVAPLSELINLKELTLKDNREWTREGYKCTFENVDALKNLVNLTKLDLSGNGISDISFLSDLNIVDLKY